MKLYYYRHDGFSNFGDDLNLWLWDQVFTNFFDGFDDCFFLGCGTLINDHLCRYVPVSSRKVVFGSGVGYGDGVPVLDKKWDICFVRGPLSAQKLGLDSSYALTDSAIMAKTVYRSSGSKKFKYSFMPHVSQALSGGGAWKLVCAEMGIHYIDPTDDVLKVMAEIHYSEFLLTEAMHGAIIADCLRVPWYPVVLNKKRVLDFKWNDWCASMELEYLPFVTIPLFDSSQERTYWEKLKFNIKRKIILQHINKILNNSRPMLSKDSKLEEQLDKMACHVSQLNKRYGLGR